VRFGLPGKRLAPHINVAPLVDVVLVLLIVFMVLTPLGEKQMAMRLPEYQSDLQMMPAETAPPDQTVLTLLASGRVALNRQELAVDQAMEILRAAFQGRPSKVLFFNAEDAASYDAAVQVLDRVRLAGVNTIGMMTDPPAAAVR
jgi:biopolymer transport protein TolR